MKPAINKPGRQSGLSMVEILVAVMIGMIGVVIIMQVLTQSESGRRTTSGLADSQSNGQLAMYIVERDLMQAGQGIVIDNAVFGYSSTTTPSPLNCTVRSNLAFNNLPLVPVLIIPAGAAAGGASNLWNIPTGDANSDMIAVAYGTATAMVEGVNMAPNTLPTPPAYSLYTTSGLNVAPGESDYVIVSENGQNCTLATAPPASINLATNTVTLDFNAGATYSQDAMLYNLGPSNVAGKAPRFAVYAVRNGVLTVCDFFANGGTDCTSAGGVNDPTIWTPVMDGVVALQAQYGWETSPIPDGAADAFCKTRLGAAGACPVSDTGTPTPANAALTAAQKACDWTRISAVRLAVVTRSGQYEKTSVSPATIKLWPDSAVAPTTTGPVFTVPSRNYRYRTFESTVSLRSVIGIGSGANVSRSSSVCY